MGIFPGGRAQPAVPAGDEGRGQPPREGTAVAERRLAQLFRQLFLVLLRLLGNHFPPPPVTNMPCGQAQPPRRFPSVATFARALGPLVPRITVKCLYGQQVNLCCKFSHYRLGRLRGGGRGGFARVGSEVGDARLAANPYIACG